MTAQVLDGKAVAAEKRAGLAQRVAALAARGPAATGGTASIVPGLVQAAPRLDDHRPGDHPGQRGGVDDPVAGPAGGPLTGTEKLPNT